MTPFYENEKIKLFCGDCRDILPELPAESIDLILADPPYSRVKPEEWDNLSHDELTFLLAEFFQLASGKLKQNGGIFCFCWPLFADQLSMIMRKYFNFLGHIVWCKRRENGSINGQGAKVKKSCLRRPFCETERIIFCENKNLRTGQSGESVYQAKQDEIFAETMRPLIDYFLHAKQESGLSQGEICEKMAELTGKKYVFARHTFSFSQWELPTREQYEAARSFMPLRREYEALRREYEALRRYHNPNEKNFTDFWHYTPVQAGVKIRIHPCQKPLELLKDMINTNCRPGGVILDPFAGSGSTGVAAMLTGRRAILIEKAPATCAKAARWLENENKNLGAQKR